jgi:type II secretion system protein N
VGDGLDGAEDGRRVPIKRLALAAVALTAVFMALGFPYDRLAARIVERVERDTGARITHGPVALALVRWAPGLATSDLRIVTQSGTRIDFTRAGARPALSLSWLGGRPALGVELDSAQGDARGVATLGEPSGYRGRVERFDLALLPQDGAGRGVRITGRADADVDLEFRDDGAVGEVAFDAREGSVQHPQLPLPLPFERLEGEIGLGGETTAVIRELKLESALASGQASGTIGRAPSLVAAPLALEIGLTVSGPVLGSLNAQGVEVGRGGQVLFQVSGTVGRPVVR